MAEKNGEKKAEKMQSLQVPSGPHKPKTSAESTQRARPQTARPQTARPQTARPQTAAVVEPLGDKTEENVKSYEESAEKQRAEEESKEKCEAPAKNPDDISYYLCSHQEPKSNTCTVCQTLNSLPNDPNPQTIESKPAYGVINFVRPRNEENAGAGSNQNTKIGNACCSCFSAATTDGSEKVAKAVDTEERANQKQYIRFNPNYMVDYLLQLMKQKWGLSFPQILVTAIGGSKDYKLDAEVARQFKKGLLNVANNDDIWITTGGTDYGVMSFVGKTIDEYRRQKQQQQKRLEGAQKKIPSNIKPPNSVSPSVSSQNGNEENQQENPSAEVKKRSSGLPVLIGFVPWSIVRDRVNLNLPSTGNEGTSAPKTLIEHDQLKIRHNWDIRLNSEHTHFVFVDYRDSETSDEKSYQKQMEVTLDLKTRFEAHVHWKGRQPEKKAEKEEEEAAKAKEQQDGNPEDDNQQIQRTVNKNDICLKGLVVGVILEGGLNSLKTVAALTQKGIPIVVTEGSGRISDVLSFANQMTVIPHSKESAINSELGKRLKETLGKNDAGKAVEVMIEMFDTTKPSARKQLVTYDIRNPHQLELSEFLLDRALKTVVGEDKTVDDYRMAMLTLTLYWNCHTIARNIIFIKKRKWDLDAWEAKIKKMFWHCVKKNQHEFIGLMLDNGCVTSKELMEIFFQECFPVRKVPANKDDCLLEPAITLIGRMIDLEIDAKKLLELKKAFESDDQLKLEAFKDNQMIFTCFFFLAAYLRHHETAKVFWERGTNFMANMLLGMRLYEAMADDEPDRENEFLEKARDFAEITMELLEISVERDVVQLRELLIAGNTLSETHSVLGLAELAQHEQFISHPSCQRVLDEVWFGAIRKERALLIFPKVWLSIFFPFPFLWTMQYNGLGNILDSEQEDEVERQKTFADINQHRIQIIDSGISTNTGYIHPSFPKMLLHLHKAPITKFFTTMIFYILFLGLFMWVVIGELPRTVQWKEYCLAGFILCFLTEEIVQIVSQPGHKKLKRYISLWNLMDICGILVFLLAIFLRHGDRRNSKNTARVFYLFDLFFWFMRFTHFFNLSKELGPVLTMILNMVPKLLRFCGIWFLFIYSFGIIMKAIAKPKHADDVQFYDLVNIINFSYWQVYGELFLEEFDDSIHREANKECTNSYKDGSGLPPCPYWPRLSIYFLAIYMMIGHLLLMNLLIAMFSSVFDEVSQRSVAHWKSKRLSLIVEYHTRSMLPPPLTLLYHFTFAIFKWKTYRDQIRRALGLRIIHHEDLLKRLGTFEREVKEEYLLIKERREALDVNRKVRSLEEEVEEMAREMKQGQENIERGQENIERGQENIEKELKELKKEVDLKGTVEKMATKIKEMKEVKDAINEELQTLKTAVDVSNLTKELQDTSKRFHDEIANLRKDEADFRSSIQKTLEEMRNLLKPPTDPKNVKPK